MNDTPVIDRLGASYLAARKANVSPDFLTLPIGEVDRLKNEFLYVMPLYAQGRQRLSDVMAERDRIEGTDFLQDIQRGLVRFRGLPVSIGPNYGYGVTA